jgi:hypothetical protein|tara:strand:+ start:491 stop:703 length:213 start_codon:yes stop_codon:yes gene_type:complete
MKLEEEAAARMASKSGKQTQFLEALSEYTAPLEQYLEDNLYNSHERDLAMESLTEALLWSRHCAETHGIK